MRWPTLRVKRVSGWRWRKITCQNDLYGGAHTGLSRRAAAHRGPAYSPLPILMAAATLRAVMRTFCSALASASSREQILNSTL